MAPPVSKHLQCSYCAKHFGRSEHLKRHELIHTSGRDFTCGQCGKGFQRRDALHRHELTHEAAGPSLLSKGVRACSACANAKTKCSGDSPCSRCQQRELQCVYPDLMGDQQPVTHSVAAGQGNAMQIDDASNLTVDFPGSVLGAVPPEVPLSFGPPTFDSDFWDPNILSTTNWLDGVIDDDLQGLQFDFNINNGPLGVASTPARVGSIPYPWNATHQTGHVRMHGQVESPAAVASNTSGRSGLSTETAADICTAQGASTPSVGEYYVDGEPARLPRMKRRKLSSNHQTERSHTSRVSPFSLRLVSSPDADLKHRIHVSDVVYAQFSSAWQCTGVDARFPWLAFEAANLPSKEVFEHLLGLYFVHFHQTLPFLHPPSFDAVEENWLMLLAMSSVGARFFVEGDTSFAISLSEVVRRNLVYQTESSSQNPTSPLTSAQLQLLLAISLVYSGDDRLTARGLNMQQTFVSAFNEVMKGQMDVSESDPQTTEEKWKRWIRREQVVRTAYSIWLVDCMWAYQFQRRPTLALEDTSLCLPCHEKHWRSTNAEDWESLSSTAAPTPSLKDALQELYVDKKLPRDRGEFARIITIHGLFQRTWEVQRYFGNPLSHWDPTAKKQSSVDILPAEPVSLLAFPTYTKWQNSVCDCIDILHWQANATIGQASGLEHPTVAFLHLSRVILLSPIDTIVRYAKTLVGLHKSSLSDMNADKKKIHLWATQGQYKARLAVIHAGVVFWHLRRYSVDAFYETHVVALATLLLWAFGTFAPRQNTRKQPNPSNGHETNTQHGRARSESPTEGSDDSACGIVLLDRPVDDELVQQFIRRGNTMRAHINGVGDLYGSQGPQRVLLEGCKLLQSLKCWGVNKTWIDLMQKLHQCGLSARPD